MAARKHTHEYESFEIEQPSPIKPHKSINGFSERDHANSDDSPSGPPAEGDDDVYEKSKSPLRWLMLLLAVFILVGPYWAYDAPAGTQVALREYFGVPGVINENSTAAANATFEDFNIKFQLLYSVYSLPNTVWPVFAGALVDKVGARAGNIASTSLALGGHALVASGMASQSWLTAWAGRAVFGIGTELMCVSARIFVAEWFLGAEVALAMGVTLATGRLSSVANDAVSGLFDADHVVTAFWVGVVLCGASLFAAVVSSVIDRRHETAVEARLGVTKDEAQRMMKPKQSFIENEDDDWLSGNQDATLWKSVKAFFVTVRTWRWSFWLLCALCLTGYCSVVAFNNVASAFLEDRYTTAGQDTSPERINQGLMVLFLSAAIAATFGGSLVDRTGCRAGFMLGSSCVVLACHLTLGFTTAGSPTVELLFAAMGCAFALFAAALWPAVAFTVPKPGLGTAYGLMGAAQNAGLVTVPIITGILQPPACSGGYICVCLMFAGIAAAGIVLSTLFLVDEAVTADKEGKTGCARRLTAAAAGFIASLSSGSSNGGGTGKSLSGFDDHDRYAALVDSEGLDGESGDFEANLAGLQESIKEVDGHGCSVLGSSSVR